VADVAKKLGKADLKRDARSATRMLKGKVVHRVWRHREAEIGVQFTGGTQFFVDRSDSGVEISIVGGPKPLSKR
jgi:hypothetical protein